MKKLYFVILLFGCTAVLGQAGYHPGNVVSNLVFPKVLNAASASSSFEQLRGKITILDFFGTWCVPCIKALPVLTKIQQSHTQVKAILISIETEDRIKAFLAKHSGLSFPLVVDETGTVTALFQPPSLPYTVVLDENGRVLATTAVTQITNKQINRWLAGEGDEMRAPELPVNKKTAAAPQKISYMKSANNTVALSQDFVHAAKSGDSTEPFLEKLSTMDYQNLQSSLKTDGEKKAFWLNLYNGCTQYQLRQNPEKYKNRSRFFRTKQITVAGKKLSLDDIEHGILRHSKIKWSLGYFGKIFPSRTEKELRVSRVDYRIHFALNCGAKSCPPVSFYAQEKLEQQLDIATKSYLLSDVELKENTAYLPAIMSWFRADFGGKKGMRKLLEKHGVENISHSTKIRFKNYDWSLYLENDKNQ